jgi:hypothetical protein
MESSIEERRAAEEEVGKGKSKGKRESKSKGQRGSRRLDRGEGRCLAVVDSYGVCETETRGAEDLELEWGTTVLPTQVRHGD